MTKKLFFLIINFFLIYSSYGQTWQWAKSIGETSGRDESVDMCHDDDNNLYLLGNMGSSSLTIGDYKLTNSGQNDIYLVQYNSNGDVLWAENYGGKGEEYANSVFVDSQKNIYIAGTYKSLSLSIDSKTIFNNGESDVFILKLNPNKQVEWLKGIGEKKDDDIAGIDVDKSGNVFITGNMIQEGYGYKIFTMKLDNNGETVWERNGTSPSYYMPLKTISIDKKCNVYIGGTFMDTIDLEDELLIHTDTYNYKSFLVKYDSAGNYKFGKVNYEYNNISTIKCNKKGELFVAADSILYGWGWGWPLSTSKVFLSKYDTSGTLKWQKSCGGESLDISADISIDDDGNIYQTGYFFSPSLTLGKETINNIYYENYYYPQVFVQKYNSDGEPIWIKEFGNKHLDKGTCVEAISDDNFYISGIFESDEISFGEHSLYNNDEDDCIYVHMRPCRMEKNSNTYIAKFNKEDISVEDINYNLSLNYFPNPVKDRITIESDSYINGIIEIVTLEGKVVKTIKAKQNVKAFSCYVDDFKKGLYIIRVLDSQGIFIDKFVKE